MSQSLIILIIIAVVFVLIISLFNKLVRLRNAFKNAYAQIDVQLKRRYDLIPNLVETVKQYMMHERETLEAVIKARNQAAQVNIKAAKQPDNHEAMQQLINSEGQLSQALGKLWALSENYPDLKADATFANLMEELTSTENRVGYARQAYNDAVMIYNTSCEQFPSNIIAGMFNFKQATSFIIDHPEERQAVRVKF